MIFRWHSMPMEVSVELAVPQCSLSMAFGFLKCEGPSGGRQPMDVTVELAACQLLLGDAPAAEATLGLAPESARHADAGVREYVLVRSPLGLHVSTSVGCAVPSSATVWLGSPVHEGDLSWRGDCFCLAWIREVGVFTSA